MNRHNYDYQWSTKDVKTFVAIYSSNWNAVPNNFKYDNYQGKKIDEKITQYIDDIRLIALKKESLREFLLEYYHSDNADYTDDLIDTIYELVENK